MSVLEEGFKEATKGLDFRKRRDRVRGFYVRRRAARLVEQDPGIDALELAVRLMGEQAVVMGYVTKKTLDLLQGPDPVSPSHLDLADMSKLTVFSSLSMDAVHRAFEITYRTDRADWIWQVVWRAVAIHGDAMWKRQTPPRELETAALDELLDRRLRAVERIACSVNSGGYLVATGARSWSVAGPTGPWKDGLRVRTVEYPFLPKKGFEPHLAQMPDWRDAGGSIMYAPADGSPPVHFPQGIASSWKPAVTSGGTIWVSYVPSQAVAPAEVLRKLFEVPREDYVERSWLFCDMVGAAVNLEALRLGKSRRSPTDTAVADAMNKAEGYASLGPVVQFDGPRDLDTLMADAADDPFFENTEIDFDDLQVGDYVLFWNSRVYRLLTHGAWGNEFSHVMGVDADPGTGRIRVAGGGPQVWLAGHGLHTTLYSSMASDLVRHLVGLFTSAQLRIIRAASADPTITTLADTSGATFVKWAPYEDFGFPGPWWLLVPRAEWHDQWAYSSLADVVKAVPRTVAHDAGGGTGYRPPPDTDAIYFPLYEPRVAQADADGDAWRAYLRTRQGDASFRAPSTLSPLKVDGRLAVGLFYRGTKAKIPVVRPRVTK